MTNLEIKFQLWQLPSNHSLLWHRSAAAGRSILWRRKKLRRTSLKTDKRIFIQLYNNYIAFSTRAKLNSKVWRWPLGARLRAKAAESEPDPVPDKLKIIIDENIKKKPAAIYRWSSFLWLQFRRLPRPPWGRRSSCPCRPSNRSRPSGSEVDGRRLQLKQRPNNLRLQNKIITLTFCCL